MRYQHLIGKPFEFGTNDCFSLMRNFWVTNYGLWIPNYSRPDRFVDYGLDLFRPLMARHGFEIVQGEPQPGDALLFQINHDVPDHGGILVDDGVLHHPLNSKSCVELYRPAWRKWTKAVMRHPEMSSIN
jgi:cell wall-associated NlpC family hydrolase